MKKEIFTEVGMWYEDEECENKLPDGTYKIYFTGIRGNYFQIINKNATVLGYIDDEYYDFTGLVNNLTKLGVTTLVDRMAEEDYNFAHGGYGYGYIKLTDEEVKVLKNTKYANYINDSTLSLYNAVKSFEYVKDGEYNAIVKDGEIYINDTNHLLVQNWSTDSIHVYCNAIAIADTNKFMKDFIYKIDDSSKLTTQTEYDSVDEFFNTSVKNDIKLDTLIICAIDTKEPLIKLQKVETNNKTEFKFIVDITNEDGDNFTFKSIIKSQEQLNQLIQQTIDALKLYSKFSKYVDDLESCI